MFIGLIGPYTWKFNENSLNSNLFLLFCFLYENETISFLKIQSSWWKRIAKV
jgi:hypothetical protein